jgi:hypothetical protein
LPVEPVRPHSVGEVVGTMGSGVGPPDQGGAPPATERARKPEAPRVHKEGGPPPPPPPPTPAAPGRRGSGASA